MEILGIDIGGSAIKGAPVETQTGRLITERMRIPTPEALKPSAMAEVIAQIAQSFKWTGPIGCGFPSAVQGGVILTAANIHKKWVGVNAQQIFAETTGCPVLVLNDADAAGMAEMTFGAGRGQDGSVIIVTIGTGLGIALFTHGQLFPNAELGHLEFNGKDAESRASDAYLNYLEKLFWPDMFILGGGVSKDSEKFIPFLTVQARVVPAQLLNEAGIVGAALAAQALQS
jgi:polyphosphate glucokinase